MQRILEKILRKLFVNFEKILNQFWKKLNKTGKFFLENFEKWRRGKSELVEKL